MTPPSNRFVGRPDNFAAIALLAAFFLPWYSAGILSINGMQMADLLKTIGAFQSEMKGEGGGGMNSFMAILFYGIPLTAAGVLVANLSRPKRSRAMSFVCGGLTAICLIWLFTRGRSNPFEAASFGYWSTIGGGAGLLLLAFQGEK